VLEDDACPIHLTRGWVAWVSAVDEAWVKKHRWCFNGERSPYAVRSIRLPGGKKSKAYLHRVIMQAPHGMVVDHDDGDTMNCTRTNLVVVKTRANVTVLKVKQGVVKYAGVNLRPGVRIPVEGRRHYRARITVGSERLYLGDFKTPEEAALAYDLSAVRHFGLHASTNFPLERYLCPGVLTWGYPSPPEPSMLDNNDPPF